MVTVVNKTLLEALVNLVHTSDAFNQQYTGMYRDDAVQSPEYKAYADAYAKAQEVIRQLNTEVEDTSQLKLDLPLKQEDE